MVVVVVAVVARLALGRMAVEQQPPRLVQRHHHRQHPGHPRVVVARGHAARLWLEPRRAVSLGLHRCATAALAAHQAQMALGGTHERVVLWSAVALPDDADQHDVGVAHQQQRQ